MKSAPTTATTSKALTTTITVATISRAGDVETHKILAVEVDLKSTKVSSPETPDVKKKKLETFNHSMKALGAVCWSLFENIFKLIHSFNDLKFKKKRHSK